MDPITGSMILGGASMASSAIGGMMNASAQDSANNQNHVEAEINRGFQERMRATSHQTEVKDLEAAGLNPILSAGGPGAAMASGSQATATAARPGDAISGGISSALGVMAAKKGMDKTDTDIANTQADTNNKKQQTDLIGAQTKSAEAQAQLSAATSDKISKMLPAELKKAQAEGDFSRINQIMGVAKSGLSSVSDLKDILNPLKGMLGNPNLKPNSALPNPKFGTPFSP